jgi:hypothetical protein
MRKLIIIAIAVLTCSCAGTNLYKKVNYGRYNANTEFYTGDVNIKRDSTFEYTRRVPHNSNTCKGNWEIISNNKMLINGIDITPFEGADSLFFKRMDCKNDTIEFISKNKIRFKDLTFKKVSE